MLEESINISSSDLSSTESDPENNTYLKKKKLIYTGHLFAHKVSKMFISQQKDNLTNKPVNYQNQSKMSDVNMLEQHLSNNRMNFQPPKASSQNISSRIMDSKDKPQSNSDFFETSLNPKYSHKRRSIKNVFAQKAKISGLDKN